MANLLWPNLEDNFSPEGFKPRAMNPLTHPQLALGRPIVKWHHKVLKNKAKNVESYTFEVQEIIADLLHHLETDPNDAGLAAGQLGSEWAIFVVHKKVANTPEHMVFVNPEIIWKSPEEERGNESCLSLPGVTVQVMRSTAIEVHALDAKGEEIRVGAAGFYARCIQHEYDHLQGITLFDKASFTQKERIRRQLAAIK